MKMIDFVAFLLIFAGLCVIAGTVIGAVFIIDYILRTVA